MKTKTYTAKTETLLQEQANAFKSNYDFQCNVIDPLRKYGRSKIAVTYSDLDMGVNNTLIEQVLKGLDLEHGVDAELLKGIFDTLADDQHIDNPDCFSVLIVSKTEGEGEIHLNINNHSKKSQVAIARMFGQHYFGKGGYRLDWRSDVYSDGMGGEEWTVNKSGEAYSFSDGEYIPTTI